MERNEINAKLSCMRKFSGLGFPLYNFPITSDHRPWFRVSQGLLTLISVEGGLLGPLSPISRYLSTVSRCFDVIRSPLVSFSFKTYLKHISTRFWNFFAPIFEIFGWRLLISIDFERKLKIWFLKFFQKNHIFSVWNWNLYEKCNFLRYSMFK